MKKVMLIFVVFAIAGFVLFRMFFPSVSRSEVMREALQHSERVMVYEGLPHQMGEVYLLEREKKRKDVVMRGGFPFYDPAVEASAEVTMELKSLLVDSASYHKYQPGKKCGGFHPDYALRWEHAEQTYWLLVCFGCGEVMFIDGSREIKHDLDHNVELKLRRLLAGFQNKRPKSHRVEP